MQRGAQDIRSGVSTSLFSVLAARWPARRQPDVPRRGWSRRGGSEWGVPAMLPGVLNLLIAVTCTGLIEQGVRGSIWRSSLPYGTRAEVHPVSVRGASCLLQDQKLDEKPGKRVPSWAQWLLMNSGAQRNAAPKQAYEGQAQRVPRNQTSLSGILIGP